MQMEIVDSGKDKVKKICDALKKQTLDPAKQEAKTIIDNALKEAEKIVKRAKDEVKELYEEHKKKLQQEKKAFNSSLQLSSVQTLQVLRQELEENLFNKNIAHFFKEATNKEDVVAEFVNVIVKILADQGLDANLQVMIPKSLSKEHVVAKLTKQVLSSLKDHAIVLSDIAGGAKVKLQDKNLVLEMTDESLRVLFEKFIRDDFRAVLFSNNS